MDHMQINWKLFWNSGGKQWGKYLFVSFNHNITDHDIKKEI